MSLIKPFPILTRNLKLLGALALIMMLSFSFVSNTDFFTEQLKYERVRKAIKEKQTVISKLLASKRIDFDDFNLLIIAYKDADELDLYAKNKQDKSYKHIATYEICSRSGQLGPKRKQGDDQVPEGFYYIERFNPASSFYLSLGLSYPNKSDRIKSKSTNLGGDIFIHGSCVTIGCMPMTDDKIKEIYLLSIYAKKNGQTKIPVYAFPFKMNDANMSVYSSRYKNNKELISFWRNLKTGYDLFMKDNRELNVSVAGNGDYQY